MENILNRPGSCAFLFRQIMNISKLRSPFTHNHAHRWQGSYSESLASGFAGFQTYTLTHTCHLLIAEACILHGIRLNCLDVILSESPSLPDSAVSGSLPISLDASPFFLALALCLLHFCLCPPWTWSFLRAKHRAYDIVVKTQVLETDAWVPVLTSLHTSCATSATYWTFLGTVPPLPIFFGSK